MINILNDNLDSLNRLNKSIGINLTIPKVTKKHLDTSAAINASIGTGLIVTGLITSSKWLTIAGSMGILSGVIQKIESNSIDD